MRVVHLNTYATGGAGRAALNLHLALRTVGVDSSLLVRDAGGTSDVEEAQTRAPSRRWWGWVDRQYIDRNRTPLSNTYFTPGYPGHEVADLPAVRAADIVHLHWVAEFLSPPVLARLLALGKPVVWTLHDQRPYTGGCHFSAGCSGYERDCQPCPQLAHDPCALPAANLRDQMDLLPAEQLTVVAPSR